MLPKFMPRSRGTVITTCVAGAVVLAGGGIAAGAALAGSPQHSAPAPAPGATPARHAKSGQPAATSAAVVTALTGNTVTVDTKRGSKTYTLTGATTYREGTSQVSAAALQKGDRIRIRIEPGPMVQQVARAVTIVAAPSAKPSRTA